MFSFCVSVCEIMCLSSCVRNLCVRAFLRACVYVCVFACACFQSRLQRLLKEKGDIKRGSRRDYNDMTKGATQVGKGASHAQVGVHAAATATAAGW